VRDEFRPRVILAFTRRPWKRRRLTASLSFSGSRPRVHHVAYAVPRAEVEALRIELDQRGLPTYLSAQLGEVENTFHNASALLGHDVEIQVDSAEFREFFEMVRGGAEDWDGSDPLRPVGA